ncbi:MAG: endonuclease/exonuclease/phosphatase family protein, partial [Candidatus Competibacterales bacterium]
MSTINPTDANRPLTEVGEVPSNAPATTARFDAAEPAPRNERPAPRVMTGGGGAPVDNTLTAVTWNLESGEANPNTLANQAKSFVDYGTDIIGFQEVDSQGWLDDITDSLDDASGDNFESILGRSGAAGGSRGNDFLGIAYNKDKLELLGEPEELDFINRDGRGRSPLVATFRHKETGEEFMYVVNHLRRGNGQAREGEAEDLNQWARQQSLPIVNVGDFNWDYDVSDGAPEAGNRAMEKLLEDGAFKWVEPEVKTPTYKSNRYDSILDGILTANGAQDWKVIDSEVINKAPFNAPDDRNNADHIPVLATFVLDPEANYTPPTPIDPVPTPDPVPT